SPSKCFPSLSQSRWFFSLEPINETMRRQKPLPLVLLLLFLAVYTCVAQFFYSSHCQKIKRRFITLLLLGLFFRADSTGRASPSMTSYNQSGSAQSGYPISIPRVFRAGDIPHFAQVIVNGTAVLTQCDVKNRWPDGSLKFAIVSFVIPSIAATGPLQIGFQDQSTGNNTGFLDANGMLNNAYDFDG